MNRRTRGILYGMVFGDGCLYMQTKNSCRLVVGHSIKQKEYLLFKAKLLGSLLGGKPPWVGAYTSHNKTTNKSYTQYQMVKTYKYFRQMHRVLYPKGKKVYTRKALDYLTDYGLALWFCDDGCGTLCKNKMGKPSGMMTRISTYCSLEEAEIIRDWFLDKYGIGIKFDVDKRNNLVSIRMNTTESRKFVKIVEPYIPQSMKYKIKHVEKY